MVTQIFQELFLPDKWHQQWDKCMTQWDKCMTQWDKCMAQWDKCMTQCDKCMAQGDKCMAQWDKCMTQWDKCMAKQQTKKQTTVARCLLVYTYDNVLLKLVLFNKIRRVQFLLTT